jgi:beta-mannosidase
LYKTTIDANQLTEGLDFLELEFEGLDTICDAYLVCFSICQSSSYTRLIPLIFISIQNGRRILRCNNQYKVYLYELCQGTVESSRFLASGNTLLLHFKSAKEHALAEARLRGFNRGGSVNLGDPSRLYIRKAQYDWRFVFGNTYSLSELCY